MKLTDAAAHAKEKARILREYTKPFAEAKVGEATKKYIERCLERAEYNEQLAAWLTELQERREADRWIPVSEKLPDEYGNYLVFTSDNDIDIGTFNPRFEDSWSMCDANGFYWVRQKGIEITHWKPLPKFTESEAENGIDN